MPAPAKATESIQPNWFKPTIAGQYVNSVGISADGSRVVAGTYFLAYDPKTAQPLAAPAPFQVGVFAWDNTGAALWNNPIKNVTEGVYWMAISRDGSSVAAGGRTSSTQGFIYAYDGATGTPTLNYGELDTRANMVALSEDGTYLVAGADQIYLFTKNGGQYGTTPSIQSLSFTGQSGDQAISVGITSDGSLIVASTASGYVVLIPNNGGTLGTPVYWQIPSGAIHWAAIAAGGSTFAAGATAPAADGSGNVGAVFCFDANSSARTLQPLWSLPMSDCENCRCVYVDDQGAFISAVGNPSTGGLNGGYVYLFKNVGGTGTEMWNYETLRNPNLTTMDAHSGYITVADGYPDATHQQASPGHYYLLDMMGALQWVYETDNMSWPMVISANAAGVFAGCDNGQVYYFATGFSGRK